MLREDLNEIVDSGPRPFTCQRKKRQRAISIGASHTALKYTTKSISFWVSADTRFTISPTVHVLLAELLITSDWE